MSVEDDAVLCEMEGGDTERSSERRVCGVEWVEVSFGPMVVE